MVEGGGGVAGPAARRCCGGGCGLGRLVRRLRRQGRQALCAAGRPAPSVSSAALRGCQYDPLSYARNFDHTGFGDPDDADAASSLYYSYTFSSRFVLAPASTATSAAAAVSAPNGIIVTAARPTAASH